MEIDAVERLVYVEGKSAKIGARAFDVLLALVERHDRVISKNELKDRVWPMLVIEGNNLLVHLVALRKLLGHGRSPPSHDVATARAAGRSH